MLLLNCFILFCFLEDLVLPALYTLAPACHPDIIPASLFNSHKPAFVTCCTATVSAKVSSLSPLLDKSHYFFNHILQYLPLTTEYIWNWIGWHSKSSIILVPVFLTFLLRDPTLKPNEPFVCIPNTSLPLYFCLKSSSSWNAFPHPPSHLQNLPCQYRST